MAGPATTFYPGKEVIAINGVAGVDSFSDLTIVSAGGNAVISWGTGDSVTLDGVRASALSAADFSFSASPTLNAGTVSLQLLGGNDHHAASISGSDRAMEA